MEYFGTVAITLKLVLTFKSGKLTLVAFDEAFYN